MQNLNLLFQFFLKYIPGETETIQYLIVATWIFKLLLTINSSDY